MKFGLLLPHFGEHASRRNVIDGARLAEQVGFDSVWVRDHLVFEPHGEMEKPDRTFYDALTTLTAIGAVTERLELGTGSLIPFRHPLVTALMAGTITQLVGPRLILGFGAGTFDHEFDAVFSNAALHWMRNQDTVLAGVHRALKQGGRFVAEIGGHGNIAAIQVALRAVFARHGLDATQELQAGVGQRYCARGPDEQCDPDFALERRDRPRRGRLRNLQFTSGGGKASLPGGPSEQPQREEAVAHSVGE